MPGDTVKELHERIKDVEWVLYPKVIRKFLAGEYDHIWAAA